MRWAALVLVVVVLLGSTANAQWFLPENPDETKLRVATDDEMKLFALYEILHKAKLSILCQKSDIRDYSGQKLDLDVVSYDQLRHFASAVRDEGFELPEYSEVFTPYIMTAINAPNLEVAVGALFAEFGIAAEEVVAQYETALQSAKIKEPYRWETKNLKVSRLFRCEELAELYNEMKGQ